MDPATIATLFAAVDTVGKMFGGHKGQRAMGAFRNSSMDMFNSMFQPGGFESMAQRFMPTSSLQRTSRSGIEAFLNQPAPEMRTFETARPILEGMLTGTGPQFEADIGAANATGGRFGSANAIMRGEALRHLFNQRTQTAQTLGMLAGQAGDAPFKRMLAGGEFANNEAIQRAQLLIGLLGMGLQTSTPQGGGGSGIMDFAKLLTLAGAFKGQGGMGGGGARGGGNTGWTWNDVPAWLNTPSMPTIGF